MDSNWIVIGIGGATCSGKTMVATELHAKIPGSVLLHQDDFFFPKGSPQLEFIEEIQHYNWDTLSAIDTEEFLKKIHAVMNDPITDRKTLIIEGHLIFNTPEIVNLCSKKYFFIVSKETARYRRRTRKYKRYDERYFDWYAWPSYETHKISAFNVSKDMVVLDGDLELAFNVDKILADISVIPPCI